MKTTISKHNSFDKVDSKKFAELVESGFGRKLVPGYFEEMQASDILLASKGSDYAGAIVIQGLGNGISYMDKIVVAKEFQQNGVGKEMWNNLNGHSEKILWRAKKDNPINAFYKKKCDAYEEMGEWIIYWKGLTIEEIQDGIRFATEKKETLMEA